VKEVRLMRFLSTQHNAIEADASVCTTSSANGTAPASGYPRAEALPKVRKLFEDAHRFAKVRILENPGDLFEDAHPFPRCARKTAHLRKTDGPSSSHWVCPRINGPARATARLWCVQSVNWRTLSLSGHLE
jgi:hypothetical protein